MIPLEELEERDVFSSGNSIFSFPKQNLALIRVHAIALISAMPASLALLLSPAVAASFVGGSARRAQGHSLDHLRMSTVKRNANIAKLQAGYLFPEIGRRRNAFLEENPDAKIISLGIGDTTQPVPDHILSGLAKGVSNLGSKETYTGYGAEQGQGPLREKIAQVLYDGKIAADEVFVSDGSKCDIGRLQMMFGNEVTSAVQVCSLHHHSRVGVRYDHVLASTDPQDPSYPVYVDTSVIMGQTGDMNQDLKQYGNIVYMPCNPDNSFFPDLENTPRADVVYFCSPNNPTGPPRRRPCVSASDCTLTMRSLHRCRRHTRSADQAG